MSRPPKLSIVIPTFNSAATLERCLQSVFGQTFRDRELIVVDGASTDGTLELIARHRDSIARVLSEPDRGVYDAMNKGIALARGEWIYFLGSDDRFFAPDVLQRFFEPDPVDYDMLYGDVIKDGQRYDGPFDLYKIAKSNICHQAIFLRRAVFGRLGPFSLEFPLWGDYEMNWRLFGDPAIRKCYKDVVVADYAAGGKSSLSEDPVFQSRRAELMRSRLRLSRIRFQWLRLLDKLARRRLRSARRPRVKQP